MCLPAAGLNGCGMEESEGKHKSEQALEHNQGVSCAHIPEDSKHGGGAALKRNPDNNVRM